MEDEITRRITALEDIEAIGSRRSTATSATTSITRTASFRSLLRMAFGRARASDTHKATPSYANCSRVLPSASASPSTMSSIRASK